MIKSGKGHIPHSTTNQAANHKTSHSMLDTHGIHLDPITRSFESLMQLEKERVWCTFHGLYNQGYSYNTYRRTSHDWVCAGVTTIRKSQTGRQPASWRFDSPILYSCNATVQIPCNDVTGSLGMGKKTGLSFIVNWAYKKKKKVPW